MLAIRLPQSLLSRFSFLGEELLLHFRLDAALMPQDSQDRDPLIRYADIAMCVFEREGPQRLLYFDPKMLEDNTVV